MTTSLNSGMELYEIAKDLLHIKNEGQARVDDSTRRMESALQKVPNGTNSR